MNLVSEEILIDKGQKSPVNAPAYPSFDEFAFGDPPSWTKGHPFNVYKKM